MQNTLKNEKRGKIPHFAPFAVADKPFTKEKHYLDGQKICFDFNGEQYANHIEMSGFYCSAIISYGANADGKLCMLRHTVFPNLRIFPNETRGSFDYNFNGVSLKQNGEELLETVLNFTFDGILNITSKCGEITVKRQLFAAVNSPALIEKITVENCGAKAVIDIINHDAETVTDAKFCHNFESIKTAALCEKERFLVKKGETETVFIAYCAAKSNEVFAVEFEAEYKSRMAFLSEISQKFVVKTPEKNVNTMAHYAKIRAAESIFKTKAGLMHSPGGGNYYAALWTNDQCEYVNPFFANLGYDIATLQSINSYKLYQKYISPEKALITSIVAAGDDIWHGAGDRGDSAMYASGICRFLLSLGNKALAEDFIHSIRDCLEYTISQKNEFGVIKSDSDELENRLISGNANLCTSCLAYDAFISAAFIEQELGNTKNAKKYRNEAKLLYKAIENYFGKNVEGFDTYMYCLEETNLRSWIAMPLVVGINDRAKETAKALLSDKLRVNEGLVSRSGEKTFWDRSTLYSLRGLFYAGLADEAKELFLTYSTARTLGEHIPYAVEAFPEGNQAQLSAESGLYLRIFTEGLLGYRPTGFNKFELAPNLPRDWNELSIENIILCGKMSNIAVIRRGEVYEISVKSGDKTVCECALKTEISL